MVGSSLTSRLICLMARSWTFSRWIQATGSTRWGAQRFTKRFENLRLIFLPGESSMEKKSSSNSGHASRRRADLARLQRMTDAEVRRTTPPEMANLPEDFWRGGELVTPATSTARRHDEGHRRAGAVDDGTAALLSGSLSTDSKAQIQLKTLIDAGEFAGRHLSKDPANASLVDRSEVIDERVRCLRQTA